tara:strand:- start:218 stop:436 length:219 start_codon:yes stop_codon:yes gene_type:complete
MTDTLYKVPRELTYNFQEIIDYIDNLEDRNLLLGDELADANAATDMMSEDISNLQAVIKQLSNNIQLISESK